MIDNIYLVILKALRGQASQEELDQIEKWKQSETLNNKELEILRKFWKSEFNYPKIINSEEEFSKIWNAANHLNTEKKYIRKTNWLLIYKVASICLVFITFAFFIYQNLPEKQNSNYIDLVTKSNARGVKSKIYLEDGTWIWLNSSSEIQYNKTFANKNERQLSLSGEAYFEVAKDSLRPFKISTDLVQIEVLGTKFNVKTQDEDQVLIALDEGEIKVFWRDLLNIKHERLVFPGEMIRIDKNTRSAAVSSFDSLELSGWKNGILVFKNESLEETMAKLQSWYNVDITVKGTPNDQWEYSGKFNNYVLENVLQAIGYAEGVDYTINGDRVEIIFN